MYFRPGELFNYFFGEVFTSKFSAFSDWTYQYLDIESLGDYLERILLISRL